MKTLRTRDEILRALSILREKASDDVAEEERKKQNKMKREIKKVKEISEEEDEEASGDEEKSSDEEGGEEEGDEEKGEEGGDEKKDSKKKGLPGAEELKKSPVELPENIGGAEIVDRVNKIRAGSSLKDEKVQKKIDTYVMSLSADQQKSMYTYLDALARIILAGMDPAEVPVPSSIKAAQVADKEVKKKAPEVPQSDLPIVSPVVVGEGVRKKMKEVDVPIRSGRVVPFGSKSHITDLEDRIEDLMRIRSYQEAGSDTRHSFTMAINALKSQLRAAMRANGGGNPRTQPVPPMVERE